ncbi:amino acid ABC transporter permease [Inquilinus limosus]|uniref:amino acid ABC transporter permease n=1 Tax=Inquilinus limosus TaxID=171674 RepID=UPI0003FC7DAA|nr:amino acid ABC transporter permease [Inquilinus limosus]
MTSIFDFDYFLSAFPLILPYLPVTLLIAFSAMACGLIMGTGAALVRIYRISLLRQLATLYISFIRGTPLLVQIYLAYYGIPKLLQYLNLQLGTEIDANRVPALVFVVFSLSVNVGAYLSEAIRSALLSIDRGQAEAAYSIGMTPVQAMRRIILPQALAVALPNLGNNFISLIKDTSLAFLIAVVDIMAAAKIIGGRSLRFFELYMAVAVIYWVICILVEIAMRCWEAYLTRGRRDIAA